MIMKFNEDFLWYENDWALMRAGTSRISGSELVVTSAVAARPANSIGYREWGLGDCDDLWNGLMDIDRPQWLAQVAVKETKRWPQTWLTREVSNESQPAPSLLWGDCEIATDGLQDHY